VSFASPLPVLVPDDQTDAVGKRACGKLGETEAVTGPVTGTSTKGGPARNEVGLGAVCSYTRPKKSQRMPRLTVSLEVTSIVVDIHAVVVLSVSVV